MVKKATRGNTGAGGSMSAAGLGYVYNEDLLDEILGEYDSSLAAPHKRQKAKVAKKKAETSAPKKNENDMELDADS